MQSLKQHLSTLISKSLSEASAVADSNANVITASKPEFGDYQANGVMATAKQLRTNPRQLAQKVAALISATEDELIERVEIAGPGFINIHLDKAELLRRAELVQLQPQALIPKSTEALSIVVDYSSPNLAKEMHVGHLRGTIIGDCLARILERQGHKVIRQNHVGDWGTQFGMLIAYMKEIEQAGQRKTQQGKAFGDLSSQLSDLETFYRAARTRFDADPVFAETSRQSVVKLQGGDPEYRQIWQQFIEESLRHCQSVYDRLHITLRREDLKAESFYNNELGNIVTALEEKNLLSLSAGALEHIAYGTMMGKDGKPFQTRSGDTIKLVELLDEAVRRAFDLVSEKNPELEEEGRRAIADKVGIAAVKYADLSKNRSSDYIFDWSTMLSFEGNTAPYLMYAYARIKSILRKQDAALEAYRITTIDSQEERSLLIKILQLPEIIDSVAADCYPNLLCNYLYELAGHFMRFYETCPILKAETTLKNSRLSLAALTADTLQQGLDLLGIETLEQM
jgi:arginyl-tRNA synthetase